MTLAGAADDHEAIAEAHARAAREHRRRARLFGAGEAGEDAVARVLSAAGVAYLRNRQRPSTRHGDIDFLVVAAAGVFVVDAKAWADVTITVHGLARGQEDCSEALDAVARQADEVEAALADLGGVGLAPRHVHPVLAFTRQRVGCHRAGRVVLVGVEQLPQIIGGHGCPLSPAQVSDVLARLADAFPPCTERMAGAAVPVLRLRPRPRAEIGAQLAAFDVRELDLTELERASRLPIEAWMTWLAPTQLQYVRRRLNGPARLRGPAGTGKTVVALHRAAYLAERHPGRLLVTSFVRTLPRVQRNLYAALSPHTLDRVDFSGVHAVALEVLQRHRHLLRVDPKGAETAFSLAWIGADRETLGRQGLDHGYWQDEIARVIKGRGITTFEAYADLNRVGRRTAIDPRQRRAAWDLYVAYEAQLRQRGVGDFADLLLIARDLVRADPADRPYRFVIADEIQDLPLVGVQLLHALVGDQPDGLTLVGDGQQSIYPGGFTLREAGINVVGRSVIFEVNYRNTRQVLDMAASFVAGEDFDDLDEDAPRGRIEGHRDGPPVRSESFPDRASRVGALVARILGDVAAGTPIGGMAVLARTKREAAEAATALRRAGLPVVDLGHYDGRQVDAVKAGTVARAKGLEFEAVYFLAADVQAAELEAEVAQRRRHEAFVALTRTRRWLWIGSVAPPPPAS